MPFDVLLKYYDFDESYKMTGTDYNTGASTSYNLSFYRKDEAIDTMLWQNSAGSYIKISFSFSPNGDISARINNRDMRVDLRLSGLIKETWDFDYMKYVE